jgi:hypothetical protein
MPTIQSTDDSGVPRGTPSAAPMPAPGAPLHDGSDPPEVSPVEAVAIRISAMIAVWLGY